MFGQRYYQNNNHNIMKNFEACMQWLIQLWNHLAASFNLREVIYNLYMNVWAKRSKRILHFLNHLQKISRPRSSSIISFLPGPLAYQYIHIQSSYRGVWWFLNWASWRTPVNIETAIVKDSLMRCTPFYAFLIELRFVFLLQILIFYYCSNWTNV